MTRRIYGKLSIFIAPHKVEVTLTSECGDGTTLVLSRERADGFFDLLEVVRRRLDAWPAYLTRADPVKH